MSVVMVLCTAALICGMRGDWGWAVAALVLAFVLAVCAES